MGQPGHEETDAHDEGLRGWLLSIVRPHSHDAADSVDARLESSARGIWALKISLLGLGATAAFQVVIVLISGSVALLVETLRKAAIHVPGVQAVDDLRVRWLGHRLEADLRVVVDEDLPTRESHDLAEAVRHALFHTQPKLATVVVHVDPCGHSGGDHHATTEHHQNRAPAAATWHDR